ncbi:MAG: hypothetical protein HY866_06975 [Chloroflexi bacterium]|nr:hypothetical protein [Chloroflexota bacterium]
MTLQEMIKAIDLLHPDELRQLRSYIDQRESAVRHAYELSPEERIQRMDAAVEVIREGMTQAELDEMIEAMNAEYIEPFDEELWKD